MTDIVERLRLLQSGVRWACGARTAATLEEAADEIERLRAERDRLRENVARCEASMVAWVEAVGECNEDRKRLLEALERAADALSDASLLDAWADARAAIKETGHE